MSDFVKPEIERLQLRGGQFVDIKKRLNHGEREDIYAVISAGGSGRHQVRTLEAMAYIVGWSLTDNGSPVAMSPELPEQVRIGTIRNLSTQRFDEIHKAIIDHVVATKESDEAKKPQDGANGSSAISSSHGLTAGVTNGSEP